LKGADNYGIGVDNYGIGVGAGPGIGEAQNWVTVFGASDPEYLLKTFQKYGDLLNHKLGPPNSNWIHIQYKNAQNARKALSKNGCLFDGIMLGVKVCSEEQAIKDTRGIDRLPIFKTQQQPHEYPVEYSTLRGPRPNTSIYSKVMEHVFGW